MPLPNWPSQISVTDDGPTVCHFYKEDLYDYDRGQVEANARLIAASPALLEACKAALSRLESFNQEHNATGQLLMDAIALAEVREGDTQ
ncbi:MAG: hypothetical protein DWQ20_00845 [Actinobacteria bacterium]|nr:MAG: hypothetical protein DWQ20_00845 [Actinomycetota bacterium]